MSMVVAKVKLSSPVEQQEVLPAFFRAIDHRGDLVALKLELLTIEDTEKFEVFAELMARLFVTSEPTTVAAGINEQEFKDEILHYLHCAHKDNLSLIITNVNTGKIVGGIIGRDFANDESEDPFVNLPSREKFDNIFNILSLSKERFKRIITNDGYKLKPGLAYRGFFIGFLGKYIYLKNENGVELPAYSFRTFEEYIKNLGYKYLYGEATNPGSQNLFRNSGWNIDNILIPYSEHDQFKHINFHAKAIPGVGNALSGAYRKLDSEFEPVGIRQIKEFKCYNKYQLGFPHNLDFDCTEMQDFLNFHINNAGDVRNSTNYLINSRKQEEAVLNFFSKAYQLPPEDAWGYLTSGATEANQMALYMARCKFPDGVVITSDQSHYSLRVCAHYLQMPLHEISSNANGEINCVELQEKLQNISGTPILALNVGTTMKGAIDNLKTVISILNENNIENYYIHCDAALHGGFLPFIDNDTGVNFNSKIDSICISLHKFIGMPFPSAVFLSREENIKWMPTNLVKTTYNGKRNHTLPCSRNGLAAIIAYSRLVTLGGQDGIRNSAEKCFSLADYLYDKLEEISYPKVIKNKFSNIVTLATPSLNVCRKWQLSVDGEMSHVVVMPHVTKEAIEEFLMDIRDFS